MRVRVPLAVTTLCFAAAAHAHAILDQADPKVGSVVRTAPAEVRLRFSEALEPAFSTVQVLGEDGKRVEVGRPQVNGAAHDVLTLALPQLAPGAYVVRWRAVSVDTHVTEGRYVFTVRH